MSNPFKCFFLLPWLLVSAVAFPQVPAETIQIANHFLKLLTDAKYTEAVSYFEPIVLQQLPAERLEKIWDQVNEQAGQFEEHTRTRSEKLKNWNVVYLTCQFERSRLDLKLVFTGENKITGIFFVPPKPEGTYHLPLYSNPEKYIEKPFIVKSGTFELPGTLTLPENEKTFPLVVLVHGSGPNDRDETIDSNKPFKDLATGLATRGIAVLRYDKRTFVYGKQSQVQTMEDETTKDARNAILQAGKIPGVTHVYLLGHSQGAYDAPEIADGLPDLAGIIMMAGNARPLEDLIIEQTHYLLSLNGFTDAEKNTMKEIEQQVKRVKNPHLDENMPADSLPLNVPAVYWLALKKYHPLKIAEKLQIPVFILQGERDYQVTMTDYKIWQTHLGNKQNVSFKSYPKLNHLFMEGTGKSKPEEYSKPGHIAENVIVDLSNWIQKH